MDLSASNIESFGTFLGHFSFFMIALSFWLRNIFLLRVVSIVASTLAIIYNYKFVDEPNWMIINWHGIFILTHCFRIGVILQERYSIDLGQRELSIHKEIFPHMSLFEFVRLMRASEWKKIPKQQHLTRRGESPEGVYLIEKGKVDVSIEKNKVADLGRHKFIGEMSFLTGETASADTKTIEECEMLFWDGDTLKELLKRNPDLLGKTNSVFSGDMAKKLHSTNLAKRPKTCATANIEVA